MKIKKSLSIQSLAVIGMLYYAPSVLASSILGSAENYAVLSYAGITNTGSTTINGNIGSTPTQTITGWNDIIFNVGVIDQANALQAQNDATSAYNTLKAMHGIDESGKNLGGMTLNPGTYYFSSSAQLTGNLTLDAHGDPNALFIFEIGSTLITETNSKVNLINGGNASNEIYWQVGSSATLGTSTTFAGNILANSSITLDTSAEILGGRAIALGGAVTMDTNTINYISSPTSSVPAPAGWVMTLLGLPMIGWGVKKSKKTSNTISCEAVAA